MEGAGVGAENSLLNLILYMCDLGQVALTSEPVSSLIGGMGVLTMLALLC